MRVLGIDPGLRNMGWGVIAVDGSRLRHVANGVIQTDAGDLGVRLLQLYRGLTAVITAHAPDAAAVEQTFVNKDAVGTLKLGQARGIVKALDNMPPQLAPDQRRRAERVLLEHARHADAGALAKLGPAVLAEVAPELAEWSALFAAGAERRARAEAGIADAAGPRDADDLLRSAGMFLRLVERMLLLRPAAGGTL